MEPVLLYITAPSREEAITLCRYLTHERLIVCANIVDAATSIYVWEGQVQEAREAIIFAKTTRALADEATARIRERHSYQCACVVEIPIQGGNPDYLKWIADNARPFSTPPTD